MAAGCSHVSNRLGVVPLDRASALRMMRLQSMVMLLVAR
jgi:hypothetical protein